MNQNKGTSNKTWLIIGVVAILIVIAVIAFLVFKKDEPKDTRKVFAVANYTLKYDENWEDKNLNTYSGNPLRGLAYKNEDAVIIPNGVAKLSDYGITSENFNNNENRQLYNELYTYWNEKIDGLQKFSYEFEPLTDDYYYGDMDFSSSSKFGFIYIIVSPKDDAIITLYVPIRGSYQECRYAILEVLKSIEITKE